MVAPAKSSLNKTSTGLNQKRAFGVEVCNPLIIVAFAEAPQPDLVKVVEAKGPREGARELNVSRRGWDDIGEVELEEVGRADDDFGIDVSDEGL